MSIYPWNNYRMHSTTPPFDHISTKCDTNQASWTSPGQISSLWNYYHRQLITTPFLNLAPAHTIVNISSYIQPKNIPSLHHWLMIHPSTSGQPEVRIWSTWTSLPTCQCGIFCLHRDHPEQNKHAPWKGGGRKSDPKIKEESEQQVDLWFQNFLGNFLKTP